MRSGSDRAGFSFIEMIVVLVITTLLGGVLYRTFSSGVLLWGRGVKDQGEWRAELFLEKLTTELRNAFQDPQWLFQGTKQELYFSTLAADSLHNKGTASNLGLAYFHYGFDPTQKILRVQKFRFEDVFAPEPVFKGAVPVLNQVRNILFEYYYYDPSWKKYEWIPVWEKEKNCLPEAIRVTVESEQARSYSVVRMIDLPTRTVCQK